jgi:hypothetical protein
MLMSNVPEIKAISAVISSKICEGRGKRRRKRSVKALPRSLQKITPGIRKIMT